MNNIYKYIYLFIYIYVIGHIGPITEPRGTPCIHVYTYMLK